MLYHSRVLYSVASVAWVSRFTVLLLPPPAVLRPLTWCTALCYLVITPHLVHGVTIAQPVRPTSAAQPCGVGPARAPGPLVAAHVRGALGIDLAMLRTPHARLGRGSITLAFALLALALGEVADVERLAPMPPEAVAGAVGIGTTRP